MDKKGHGIKQQLYNVLIEKIKVKSKLILGDYFKLENDSDTPYFTHMSFLKSDKTIKITITFPTDYSKNANARIGISNGNPTIVMSNNPKRVTYYALDDDGDTMLRNLEKIKTSLILKNIFVSK